MFTTSPAVRMAKIRQKGNAVCPGAERHTPAAGLSIHQERGRRTSTMAAGPSCVTAS